MKQKTLTYDEAFAEMKRYFLSFTDPAIVSVTFKIDRADVDGMSEPLRVLAAHTAEGEDITIQLREDKNDQGA